MKERKMEKKMGIKEAKNSLIVSNNSVLTSFIFRESKHVWTFF